MRVRGSVAGVLVAVVVLAGACSSGSSTAPSGSIGTSGSSGSTPGSGAAASATADEALLPLHAVRGADARVLDSRGRQVLLRGVNLNSLGDYYQPNPAYPQVIPVTDADWARMRANGFDVVRLLVHWSLLEPTRGNVDQGYLDRIHQAVDAAAAHGIYAVIDMHQDAFSKTVATPADVECPTGTKPDNGWDGAPAWATLTDGESTCAPAGVRELAPAVIRAFENFYANTDGIQDELVATWKAVAASFAKTPSVAGYDLFNEPNWGADAPASGARLGAFTKAATAAIREGEQAADGTSHIVFFEPVVVYPRDGTLVPPDDASDPNMVFAPHNYNESINPGTLEDGFTAASQAAATYGTTFWIGEYGWFGDPAKNQAAVARYAAQEDQYRVGGSWWQWKQACGDPHSIGAREPAPADLIYQFNLIGCPGDRDEGPVKEWQPILSRAYPRAAPGTIRTLSSDGLTGAFTMTGSRGDASSDSRLDLWVPSPTGAPPVVGGTGVSDVQARPVDGGFRVTATVCGDYTVRLGPGTTAVATGSTPSC